MMHRGWTMNVASFFSKKDTASLLMKPGELEQEEWISFLPIANSPSTKDRYESWAIEMWHGEETTTEK